MLDIAFIRSHPDIVKEAARVKNNTLDIDYLLEVDRQVLALQRQVEDARAQQNQLSRRVQQAGKDTVQRDALIAEGKQLAEQIKAMEPQLNELQEQRSSKHPQPTEPDVDQSTQVSAGERDGRQGQADQQQQEHGTYRGSSLGSATFIGAGSPSLEPCGP